MLVPTSKAVKSDVGYQSEIRYNAHSFHGFIERSRRCKRKKVVGELNEGCKFQAYTKSYFPETCGLKASLPSLTVSSLIKR